MDSLTKSDDIEYVFNKQRDKQYASAQLRESSNALDEAVQASEHWTQCPPN